MCRKQHAEKTERHQPAGAQLEMRKSLMHSKATPCCQGNHGQAFGNLCTLLCSLASSLLECAGSATPQSPALHRHYTAPGKTGMESAPRHCGVPVSDALCEQSSLRIETARAFVNNSAVSERHAQVLTGLCGTAAVFTEQAAVRGCNTGRKSFETIPPRHTACMDRARRKRRSTFASTACFETYFKVLLDRRVWRLQLCTAESRPRLLAEVGPAVHAVCMSCTRQSGSQPSHAQMLSCRNAVTRQAVQRQGLAIVPAAARLQLVMTGLRSASDCAPSSQLHAPPGSIPGQRE